MPNRISIGSYQLKSNLLLAPMAGVTDRPFRQLCRQMGAGLAVSEMMAANPDLRHTRKSRLRMDHFGEEHPISVQIAGADPEMMADAARYNVDHGAQIIDINMGCPAKKVCNKAAGSALLKDEKLVGSILKTVVGAVDVPVTLKIRTGWDPANRNGLTISKIAEDSGIQALAVHGRTRACKFKGQAEFETISAIVDTVNIPVIANGDINSPEQAQTILNSTQADGLMIGRAAQGNPWIFNEINHFLSTGHKLPPTPLAEKHQMLVNHVRLLHGLYGPQRGLKIARKHVGWYLARHRAGQPSLAGFKTHFNQIDDAEEQLAVLQTLDNPTTTGEDIAA